MIFDPNQQESNPLIQNASGFTDHNKMHSRHPMFRMPDWMSEDDDVSTLASRMSHNPNWAFGNRGQWRDMQNQGDNDAPNHSESVAHTIPIKIEAEAPPGCMPQKIVVPQVDILDQKELDSPPKQDRINPDMIIGNQPAYASKTTPAVDSCLQEIPRDSRSSSAPPDVKEKEAESPRFISKIHITPQHPQNNTHQTFNNIAKPFPSSPVEQCVKGPIENESVDVVDSNMTVPTPQNISNKYDRNKLNQTPNIPTQKGSVIRNIPILFEGNDGSTDNSRLAPSPPIRHQNQSRGPTWNQQFGNMSDRFHDDMFQDPFFGFGRLDNHKPQRREQPMPSECAQSDFSHREGPHNFSHKLGHEQPSHQLNEHNHQHSEIPQKEEAEIKISKDVPEKQQHKDIQMGKILQVRSSLTDYQKKIEIGNITQKNKEYRYLDEMLTRALLELDNIEIDGRDDIRQARRTLVKDINAAIGTLEQKVSLSADTVEALEISKCKDSSPELMDVVQDAKKTKIKVDTNEIPDANPKNENDCIQPSLNEITEEQTIDKVENSQT